MAYPSPKRASHLLVAAVMACFTVVWPTAAQSPSAVARQARQAYIRGMQAERMRDWKEAFEEYLQATQASPSDLNLQLRREFARAQLVQGLAGQAEREILSGRTDQARANLQAALALDPTFSVARERLAQIMVPSTPPAPVADTLPRLASGPAKILAQPGTRSFNHRGTTRSAYEELARQFGVRASFDVDLADRAIRFIAPDVDFETAMRVLGQQTVTFWRSLDSRTFFVTPDTPDKRRNYDPIVEQTILLPASQTNDEMTETFRMVREIVGLRRSELNLRTHTLTVRDTLANVALAKALVEEIEQSHGEALLDIDILEVDRQLARNMGITQPTSARIFTLSSAQVEQLEQSPNIGTLREILQSIFGAQSLLGSSATSSLLPPLIAFGGGKTIFLATLPGAAATLSQTLSVVRSARRVLLRVEDGRPATLFVGQRFPITLALLSGNFIAPGVIPGASFPRNDFNVGRNPSGIAIDDFNGDGTLDLAVVNSTDDTVSVFIGNGDGTFATAVNHDTGRGPVAVTAGDFNRDGTLDLAVVNNCTVNESISGPCAAADYSVSILLGNGNGTFGARTDFVTGTSPAAVVADTFNTNSNGNLGLAVVNQGDNSVSLLLGNGDGTFAPKQDSPVGNSPSAIISNDFDGDGKRDLAVTNRAANTFSVLRGTGDGTFVTPLINVNTGSGPAAIASSDFNRDGRLDMAVVNQTGGSVSIFPGNGDGTFEAATNFIAGTNPAALVVADFNLDGSPDVIVADQSANTISIFFGLGDGTLATPFSIATGNGPTAATAGDLNDDGLLDIAVLNQSSETVSAILNNAAVPASPSATTTSYPGSEYVDLGLKVQATPRMHADADITLDLKFDISSLAGLAVNGIPILSNRSIQQVVRLRENQTSVLSGMIQSSETPSITGLPGAAEAGPLGYLAGLRSKQQSETELVIAITPRQLRLAPRTDRTIYAGRGTGSTAPTLPPTPPTAPAGPGPSPGATPPGAPPVAPPVTGQPDTAPGPGAPPTFPPETAPPEGPPAGQPN